jgi:hypothetical protein
MSNEIKVGDWTVTYAGMRILHDAHAAGESLRRNLANRASQCVEILGMDLTTDSVARDIAEEIVLHGTPVEEVVAKLQRHLEGGR